MPKSALTTYQLARLDNACKVLESAWHWRTYLVGSAGEGDGPYRDVDVRTILDDDEFDALFGDRQQLWELVCLSVSAYLRDATGLPIDFQIQRMTQANEKFDKPRNPLGTRDGNRFAGGGDATRFTVPGMGHIEDLCDDDDGPSYSGQKCGFPIRSGDQVLGCPKEAVRDGHCEDHASVTDRWKAEADTIGREAAEELRRHLATPPPSSTPGSEGGG